MSERIILGDFGYNFKFFQLSGAKRLAITLTDTKLTLRNVNNDQIVEDAPLEDVISVKAVNPVTSTLGPSTGANLKIKTNKGYYKIGWKDADLIKIAAGTAFGDAGSELGQAYNQLSGFDKAKLWEDTFQKLKNGQKVAPIENNVDKFEKDAEKSKNQKRPMLGLTLIFFPIIVFLVGVGVAFVGIHKHEVQNNSLPALGFLVAILSLCVIPFGIIWGLRKLR